MATKAQAENHVPVRTADLTSHDAASVHVDAVHWGHGWHHGYYYGAYRVGYRGYYGGYYGGWGYRYPYYANYYPRYYYPRYYGSYYYPSYYSTYYPVSPFSYGLAVSTLYPPAGLRIRRSLATRVTVAGYAHTKRSLFVARAVPVAPSGYFAPYGAYYW